jgi:hypothetical protein
LTVLAVLAAVLIIALAIIGRTAPDLVDHLLYTPEELKILNYTIK